MTNKRIIFNVLILMVLLPWLSSCLILPERQTASFTISGRVIRLDHKGPIRVILNFIGGTETSPRCMPMWTEVDKNGDYTLTTGDINFYDFRAIGAIATISSLYATPAIKHLTFELIFFRAGLAPVIIHVEPFNLSKMGNQVFVPPFFLKSLNEKTYTTELQQLHKKEIKSFEKKIAPGKITSVMLANKDFPTVENCGTPGCKWVQLAPEKGGLFWYGCIDQERIKKTRLLKTKKKTAEMASKDMYEYPMYAPLNKILGGGLWWLLKSHPDAVEYAEKQK
ncbi:MAG: hypothetical protein GY714_06235 [Desulfobacterales bacterium]|nr:hypothetical protein [Desulfobacterales bacterium]MCP4162492.1 hypothetical protein [Deltaproteobacteria bacterium]